MAGYRDRSTYDPYSSPRYGRPLRPYNWVQWTGVACILFGMAIDMLYFAGRIGWMSKSIAPMIALPPIIFGAMLVNSRREQLTDPAPELAAARKRWLLVTVLICTVILGAAVAIDLLGAK